MGSRASSGRRSRASPFGFQPAPHDSEARVPIVGRWASGRGNAPAAGASNDRLPSGLPGTAPTAGRRDRQGRLAPPAARPRLGEGLGRRVLALVIGQGRLGHHPVVETLEPVVEEPDELVQPVHPRARVRLVGQEVDPVADQRPARGIDAALEHPQGRIDVAVHPAADQERRHGQAGPVRGERALPPERPVVLLAAPFEQPDRGLLQPLAPLRLPGLAAVEGPGRQGVRADHADRVLAQLAGGGAAADVVDIVGVAVVGGIDRHDRPQVRRPEQRHLDRGEAPPADPPHPDVAVRPGLGGQPLDRVVAVVRLVRRVLAPGDSRAAAGAPDVEPAEGVTAGCQPLPEGLVVGPAPVVLAVGDHLEDRRKPNPGRGGDREPQVGRQLEPVADGDPDVPPDLDRVDSARMPAASRGHRSIARVYRAQAPTRRPGQPPVSASRRPGRTLRP